VKLETFEEWWQKTRVEWEKMNGKYLTPADRVLAQAAWDRCMEMMDDVLSIPAFQETDSHTCKTKHTNKKSFGCYVECLDCGSIYFHFNAEKKQDV